MPEDVRQRVERYVANNADAGVMDVLGALTLSPEDRELIEEVLSGEETIPDDVGDESPSTAESGTENSPTRLDFTAPESGVWSAELLAREQWMGHVEKRSFAPWADRDHPDADDEEDARWKWGLRENYVDGETVALAEADPRLDGRVFLQQEDDPYVFVDGDDVRCPETREVHPEFVALLDRLGLTYTDISTSGTGVHANYRGELPGGLTQATFAIDEEPWGANDDIPEVEIYAGTHVCVQTGQHVPGTPTEINEWDNDALRAILEEYDQLPTRSTVDSVREPFDATEYTPSATTSCETTTDIRDLFAAINRLDARQVAADTIVHRWNDEASTSDGKRAFVPTWGPDANGTANVVDDCIWQDTGGGGYGGPVVMALIDCGDLRPETATPRDARSQLWFRGVEHLRDLGYDVPEYVPAPEGSDELAITLPNSPRIRAKTNLQSSTWREVFDIDGDDSGDSTITQQDLYARTEREIDNAMERWKQCVIDALMSAGKTYSFFKVLHERDEQGAYFAPRTELYEQAKQYALEVGFERAAIKILPSFPDDCPTYNGEHGPHQQELVQTLYTLGVKPKTIHALLGGELGCVQHGHEGKCAYEHKCEFDPEEYDLIIGHYTHAHLPHVTKARHVAFDEEAHSAFTQRLEGEQLIRAVNAFLALDASPPFDGWDDLIQYRNDPERRQAGLAWFDQSPYDFTADERNAVRFAEQGFHAYTQAAVYTILTAEPVEGHDGYPFDTAKLPNPNGTGKRRALLFTTTDTHGEYYVEIQTPPDLTYANAILALDGTPYLDPESGAPAEWANALDRPLTHRRILTDDQRRMYLSETLGNVYIQSSEYVKPYTSGDYTHPQEDAAKLRAITEEYGDGEPPVVFTSKDVVEAYTAAGFIEEGLVSQFDYPNNLRGSNAYADTRLAVQLGSTHHGDHELRRRAAMLGTAVFPDGKGVDRTYGTVGDRVLYQMREAQSAQNALRVGRDGKGAIYVFDTCAFPDYFPIENDSGDDVASVTLLSPTASAIRDVWTAIPRRARHHGVLTKHVSQALDRVGTLDASDRSIRRALHSLVKAGLLRTDTHATDARKRVWQEAGLATMADTEPASYDFPEIDTDVIDTEIAIPIEHADISRIAFYTRAVRISGESMSRANVSGISAASGGGGGSSAPPPDSVQSD